MCFLLKKKKFFLPNRPRRGLNIKFHPLVTTGKNKKKKKWPSSVRYNSIVVLVSPDFSQLPPPVLLVYYCTYQHNQSRSNIQQAIDITQGGPCHPIAKASLCPASGPREQRKHILCAKSEHDKIHNRLSTTIISQRRAFCFDICLKRLK